MTSDYTRILERLFQASSSHGMKMGLEVAEALDSELGLPSASCPTVHVAGSNGKGSVTIKIAKALELSGYRVGVYTSPHLHSFRERIVVNGESISEEEVVQGMQQIFAIEERRHLEATFFELTTSLAFAYFRRKQVDVAVIETGLGGRLDATNIVHPLLSVITSISREHQQWLGEEIEQIAREKAGIIKKDVPVILGPKARYQSIYDRAKEMNSPIFASRKISYFYDEENSAVAALALEHLAPHFRIDPDVTLEALQTRPPCRFELILTHKSLSRGERGNEFSCLSMTPIAGSPTGVIERQENLKPQPPMESGLVGKGQLSEQIGEVILDVAHNPEAIFYLLQALHTFFPDRKFRFLVGFSRDKEYDRCLDLIADVATHIHLVRADSERAATTQELQRALNNEDPHLSTPHASVEEGVRAACALAQGEILVICGSFYLMADAKRALGNQFPKDSFDLNEKTLPPVLSSVPS